MIKLLSLITVLSPLVGALIAGIFGKKIGERASQFITIFFMLVSFATALCLFNLVEFHQQSFYGPIYTWALVGNFQFVIGFMIDRLTVVMMLVVTFVSTIVHIY